jgi:hypothetical protein
MFLCGPCTETVINVSQNILPPSSPPKIEILYFSETFVITWRTTRCHNPKVYEL